jgi:hypothetical protein
MKTNRLLTQLTRIADMLEFIHEDYCRNPNIQQAAFEFVRKELDVALGALSETGATVPESNRSPCARWERIRKFYQQHRHAFMPEGDGIPDRPCILCGLSDYELVHKGQIHE